MTPPPPIEIRNIQLDNHGQFHYIHYPENDQPWLQSAVSMSYALAAF